MTSNPPCIDVVVGIVYRHDGAILLSSRPAGKSYAGFWEFAGGKIEVGEDKFTALQREFQEELGITIQHATPWITKIHDYPHARVRLFFFRIKPNQWHGHIQAREGQAWQWQNINHITVSPLLPANQSILVALRIPNTLTGNLNIGFTATTTNTSFYVDVWPNIKPQHHAMLVPIDGYKFAQQQYPRRSIWAHYTSTQPLTNNPKVDAMVYPITCCHDVDKLNAILQQGYPIPIMAMAHQDIIQKYQTSWLNLGLHGVIILE